MFSTCSDLLSVSCRPSAAEGKLGTQCLDMDVGVETREKLLEVFHFLSAFSQSLHGPVVSASMYSIQGDSPVKRKNTH